MLEFELNQANDWGEGAWTGLEYLDLPVITTSPNRKENIDISYARKSFALDNDHGLRHLADDAGRAFTTQIHHWQLRGRQQQAEFRSMLYRLAGKWQTVWLPTFNNDLTLARPADDADTHIHVNKVGYAYTGGAVAGRTHILFRTITGNYPAEITGTGVALAATEERLNLSAAVGADLLAGRSASFLEPCRLDQDDIEITHYADSDGMAECRTSFRSFTNTRQAPAIIEFPIPVAEVGLTACGEPDVDSCVDLPPEFAGIYWEIKVEYPFEGTVLSQANANLSFPDDHSPPNITYTDTSSLPSIDGWHEYLAPFGHLFRYTSEQIGEAETFKLRLQFGAGQVSGGRPPYTYARLSFKRWNEADWRVLTPVAGVVSLHANGTDFDIEGLWPRDYYFIAPEQGE